MRSYRSRRFTVLAVASGVVVASAMTASVAFAADVSVALGGTQGETDMASAWIEALFFNEGLPAGSPLTALTKALRGALASFNTAMLIVAGLLLSWHVVSMVAETAQTGVPMGRRTNQLWAPIRFLLAIGLLIPFNSGLNAGQYAIVKIAEQGSSLATRTWNEALEVVGVRFLTPLVPRSPDIERFVTKGLEMEICRSLYQQLYQLQMTDPVILQAGDMLSFRKEPARSLSDETWRYTNRFYAEAALCGGYSFLSPYGPAPVGARAEEPLSQTVADAVRASTDRFVVKTRGVAETFSSALLGKGTPDSVFPDAATIVNPLIIEQTQLIDAAVRKVITDKASKTEASASLMHGWIAAGSFPWDMARQQVVLGEIAARVVPSITPPLLGHALPTRSEWIDKARAEPGLHLMPPAQFERYASIYDQISQVMRRVQTWLYSQKKNGTPLVLPDQQDVRDALTSYSDAETGRSVLTRAMAVGAASFGVLSRMPTTNGEETASPVHASLLIDDLYLFQPLQTIAEMGRRYMAYGSWVLGLMSPALVAPSTMALAGLFVLLAAGFWAAGAVLVFLVPLVPMFRFVMAVLAWGVSLLAAIVSLPLVALAHLYPSGEGLAGPVARQAYWLWLGLFLRPVFILFGFVGGLILFFLGVFLINTLFLDWLAPGATLHSDALWLLRSALALIYAAALYGTSNAAFRGITRLPDRMMDWIGGQSILPETTVLAGANSSVASVNQTSGAAYVTSVATNASGTTHTRTTVSNRDTVPPNGKSTSRSAHAVHFPELRTMNEPAAVDIKAEARAFAAAQDAGGGVAMAGASAGSTENGEKTAALAMSAKEGMSGQDLHMPDEARLLLAAQKRRLAQEKELKKAEESRNTPKSKESPEQSAAKPEHHED